MSCGTVESARRMRHCSGSVTPFPLLPFSPFSTARLSFGSFSPFATNLKRFLIEVQNQEQATEEEAQAIIDSFNHFHRRGAGLNLETFFKFLFSDNNLPLSPSTGHQMTLKSPTNQGIKCIDH